MLTSSATFAVGGARLTPRSVASSSRRAGERASYTPRAPASTAAQRYEGGAVRDSAKLRAAHAAKPQIALKDLPAAVGKGAWTPGAEKAIADLKAGRVADTENAHRVRNADGSLGEYTPERQALHEHIINTLLQGKDTHPGSAQAIFTAGGPASGKGGLVRTGTSQFEKEIGKEAHVQMPSDVVNADPDTVRTMLPEYQQLVKEGNSEASSLTHEEASHLTKVLTKIALGRQHHILVGPGKFAGKIKDAQRAGYKVSVHYATTDTATAIKRAKARGDKTGRYVPDDFLKAAHASVSQIFPEIEKLRGIRLRVVDTTDRPNKVIAEKGSKPGDRLVIRDGMLFRRFLVKAKG